MAKQHTPAFLAIVNDAKRRVKEVSIDDVKLMQASGKKIILIDVREDREWHNGHLPNAVHIGKGVIERDIEKTNYATDQEMVLYCGGGFRSALACDNLQKMGYTNVSSMDGGFSGWKNSGHDIVVP
jgi:rhodanese-related sulfurtransferase